MDTITTAYVQEFSSAVHVLSQREGSKVRAYVRQKAIEGEITYFEILGPTVATKRTEVHVPTNHIAMQHTRRGVMAYPYTWSTLLSKVDLRRMKVSPQNEYVQAAAWAMGRALDDAIFEAVRGNAFSGKTASTPVALPAEQKIAHGGVGMTFEKVNQAARIFNDADVKSEDRVIVVSPQAVEDLLSEVEFTSKDYANLDGLRRGTLDGSFFLGFNWVMHTGLPKVANNRFCLAWAKRGVGLVVASELETKIDQLPEMNYETQIWCEMDIGATRIEDACVVEIAIVEA